MRRENVRQISHESHIDPRKTESDPRAGEEKVQPREHEGEREENRDCDDVKSASSTALDTHDE